MTLRRGRPDFAPEEIYDGVDSWIEIVGNDWSVWRSFTKPTKAIIFTARNEGLKYQISEDAVIASDDIFVFEDASLAITLEAKYWRVKNMFTDQTGNAYVNGFYIKE